MREIKEYTKEELCNLLELFYNRDKKGTFNRLKNNKIAKIYSFKPNKLPSTHEITPIFYDACIGNIEVERYVLNNIIGLGNAVEQRYNDLILDNDDMKTKINFFLKEDNIGIRRIILDGDFYDSEIKKAIQNPVVDIINKDYKSKINTLNEEITLLHEELANLKKDIDFKDKTIEKLESTVLENKQKTEEYNTKHQLELKKKEEEVSRLEDFYDRQAESKYIELTKDYENKISGIKECKIALEKKIETNNAVIEKQESQIQELKSLSHKQELEEFKIDLLQELSSMYSSSNTLSPHLNDNLNRVYVDYGQKREANMSNTDYKETINNLTKNIICNGLKFDISLNEKIAFSKVLFNCWKNTAPMVISRDIAEKIANALGLLVEQTSATIIHIDSEPQLYDLKVAIEKSDSSIIVLQGYLGNYNEATLISLIELCNDKFFILTFDDKKEVKYLKSTLLSKVVFLDLPYEFDSIKENEIKISYRGKNITLPNIEFDDMQSFANFELLFGLSNYATLIKKIVSSRDIAEFIAQYECKTLLQFIGKSQNDVYEQLGDVFIKEA